MMGHLMAVKDKQSAADNMFEPLKATIELLKTYGQELNDEVHLQVQVRKSILNTYTDKWINIIVTSVILINAFQLCYMWL